MAPEALLQQNDGYAHLSNKYYTHHIFFQNMLKHLHQHTSSYGLLEKIYNKYELLQNINH